MRLVPLLLLVACARPSPWTPGATHRFFATVHRETSLRATPIGHPDGTARNAADLDLSVVLACTVTKDRPVTMTCVVQDAGLVATPVPEHRGDLLPALLHTEARIERSAAELVLSRSGRLLEVRAYEADGVLWNDFDPLGRWLVRALSPLDARVLERTHYRLHHPVVGRLFADIPLVGLLLDVERDGDRLMTTGDGRWTGPDAMDVSFAISQRLDGDRVVSGDATATGTRDGETVYTLHAVVRSLGDASHRPLESRER